MKFYSFVAISVDGYIAKLDGNIDWLESSGNQKADLKADKDMGFYNFMSGIDAVVFGRKTLQAISKMNLKDEDWPYGKRKMYCLSKSLNVLPKNMSEKGISIVESIDSLNNKLMQSNLQNICIDGGETIRGFIQNKLLQQLTLTVVPILLGEGISLFNNLNECVDLTNPSMKVFANDYIQLTYKLSYH